MKYASFRIMSFLIVLALGAAIGWSASRGDNPAIPVAAFVLAVIVLKLTRSRVSEVVEDEYVVRLGEKAANTAFRVSAVGLALLSALLISSRDIYGLGDLGFTLAHIVSWMLLAYLLSYFYYRMRGL